MTAPKPPSTKWAYGYPPREPKQQPDGLDTELRKLYDRKGRIPEEIKLRLNEKFPEKNNAQIAWVLRQLNALKDVFMDGADAPKNLHIAPLIQYRSTLVAIRETINERDYKPPAKRPYVSKNPLKGLLTAEQEQEIQKARRTNNGTSEHRGGDPKASGEKPQNRAGRSAGS